MSTANLKSPVGTRNFKNLVGTRYEIFRPMVFRDSVIEGWEVSNFGRVRRPDGSIATTYTRDGYVLAYVAPLGRSQRRQLVHRLVAWAFQDVCGEWREGLEVDHANGDRADNCTLNLEWVSRRRNSRLAAERGALSGRRKRRAYEEIRPLFEAVLLRKESTNSAARRMGMDETTARHLLSGKRRPHFLARFKSETSEAPLGLGT